MIRGVPPNITSPSWRRDVVRFVRYFQAGNFCRQRAFSSNSFARMKSSPKSCGKGSTAHAHNTNGTQLASCAVLKSGKGS